MQGLAGSRGALIVLNEINVSRNANKDALLMKADQIGATRGRLKRRKLNRERWVRNKRMDAKMAVFYKSSIVVLLMNKKYVYWEWIKKLARFRSSDLSGLNFPSSYFPFILVRSSQCSILGGASVGVCVCVCARD